MSIDRPPLCIVYDQKGASRALELEPIDPAPPDRSPLADHVSVRTIMARDLVCARPDLEIAAVVNLVMKHRVGCIPVVDGRRRPIGVITKLDLVEQLDAAMRSSGLGYPLPSDLAARTAEDVMMPIALTCDERATIAHAASMMLVDEIHHVLVVNHEGKLVGVVSTKDIVGWVVTSDVLGARRS